MCLPCRQMSALSFRHLERPCQRHWRWGLTRRYQSPLQEAGNDAFWDLLEIKDTGISSILLVGYDVDSCGRVKSPLSVSLSEGTEYFYTISHLQLARMSARESTRMAYERAHERAEDVQLPLFFAVCGELVGEKRWGLDQPEDGKWDRGGPRAGFAAPVMQENR